MTRQLEGVINEAGTGMFKHELGPGGVTFPVDAAAFDNIAGNSPAATRLIAIADASVRSEIGNRILPSRVRITPHPDPPPQGGEG